MRPKLVVPLVFALALFITVECNREADILYAWKAQLTDPYNVLQTWDPKLVNPCSWFHVTCNSDNSVTRVDLGNAGLSGPLVPELGSLTNLQYLYLNMNKISGSIPRQLGNLTNLIGLGLSDNLLSGPIPASLGNLRSLRFMNLNSNNLSGSIPNTVIQLILWGNLQTLNVSDNQLAGTIRRTSKIGMQVFQPFNFQPECPLPIVARPTTNVVISSYNYNSGSKSLKGSSLVEGDPRPTAMKKCFNLYTATFLKL